MHMRITNASVKGSMNKLGFVQCDSVQIVFRVVSTFSTSWIRTFPKTLSR